MRRPTPLLLLVPPVLCIAAVVLYNLPPINERLAWRVESVQAKIKYAFNPPEEVVFVPQASADINQQIALAVTATLRALENSRPTPTATPTNQQSEISSPQSPTPTPTVTPTLKPLPPSVSLTGVVHEYQKWNNCGPATLAMALTYWDWEGDQRTTAPILKPNPRDKNVMPYEMEAYVNAETNLRALVRPGGDLTLLKRLLAAGFPVVVEKGFEVPKEGWMGHYEVLTGYDDAKARFTAQDSYIMKDLPVPYAELENYWQDFNYLYLLIYPPERETEVMALLGPDADETAAFERAASRASDESVALTGRDRYFALYNRGTSLASLGDYAGASLVFDEAFQAYADLPEKERPWRNVWYQTGPYFAYYYSGRYYDVINLATTTLDFLSNEPVLEESFVWRARARLALGDTDGAVEDFRKAVEVHPGFTPAVQELAALGMTP